MIAMAWLVEIMIIALLPALLDSNRRREKTELLTQAVNDVALVRKV